MLDKLQSFVPQFKIKIDLRNFINFKIIIINNNAKPFLESKAADKELCINLDPLTSEERKEVLEIAVLNDEHPLLQKESQELLEDFRAVDSAERNQRIINTLKDHIPLTDIPILRAALFLRSKFEAKENVQGLKDDIMVRYGDRGRKIANICSAGYFENEIIPLLEEMRSAGGSLKEDFLRIYETFIFESGYAVFVSGTMAKEKIKTAIHEKIKTNLKYGLKHINIHGISKETIKRIRVAADELLAEYNDLEKTTDNIIGNTIFIKLDFGPQLATQLDNR